MATPQDLRRIVATLPGAEEREHMGHPDFRVKGKIFATLAPGEEIVVFRLARDEQHALLLAAPETFDRAWGDTGWTKGRLAAIPKAQLVELLHAAWRKLAPKQFVQAAGEGHARAPGKPAKARTKRPPGA